MHRSLAVTINALSQRVYRDYDRWSLVDGAAMRVPNRRLGD
jgi:hypothetical protein